MYKKIRRRKKRYTCCRYLLFHHSATLPGHPAAQSSHYCPDRLASGEQRGPKRTHDIKTGGPLNLNRLQGQ